ncbi:hypothetical protein VPNG_05433 [Cytospora leucostoma]|uniref:F-box domain-containing protein n=1 Tax=Cytospora leucostoma TaxID=1230097 RepID=A0A423XBT3_9PEZI|nr:hypothetical protein VPNG_05433 [Cytospora leucostoma]
MSSVALASSNIGRRDQEDILNHARKLYLTNSIRSALVQDLNALSLSTNPDKLAMYKLATKSCTCGSGMVACKVAHHIVAVDGIVACYYKLEDLDKAYVYASLHVILAPEAPEGYLRMAKALRLMDTSQSPATMSRCTWIYHQAIESILTYGNKAHKKLQVLRSLLRKDIISSLPTELRLDIFKNLSHTDVCRCMRVSKAWNEVSRHVDLWKDLKFVKRWASQTTRPFRPGILNDIITRRARNNSTSLAISGMKDFDIDGVKLRTILRVLPRLESLSLRGWHASSPADSPEIRLNAVLCAVLRNASPGLKKLHLGNLLSVEHSDGIDPVFRDWSSEPVMVQGLQELTISGVESSSSLLPGSNFLGRVNLYNIAPWQRLEKLMIQGTAYFLDGASINLSLLVTAMPALKDVSLIYCVSLPPEDGSGARFTTTSWNDLERLVLQWFFVFTPTIGGSIVPQLSPGIRSLELPFTHELFYDYYKSLEDEHFNTYGEPVHTGFERLEHLRLSEYLLCQSGSRHDREMSDALAWLVQLISKSCSSGTLRSLDIPFESNVQGALDQVLVKDDIRTLSCNAFDGHLNTLGLLGREDEAVLAWLDTFPNLTTVGVFPEDTEVGKLMIARLLAKGSMINTIYTNVLTGRYRDDALEMAAKKGIRLIHANRVPEPELEPLPK